MKIAIVGTGYVGLVTGTCFAEVGNDVTCVDIDPEKVTKLRDGVSPIFEPGLEALIRRNIEHGRLHFTTDLSKSLAGADIAFIAVGTPQDADGSADLRYVLGVATSIGTHMKPGLVVTVKSTVPVGTCDKVEAMIRAELGRRGLEDTKVDVASNPEFLKEGAAIDDFMKPDRIVVGLNGPGAETIFQKLYEPFITDDPGRLLLMDRTSSELTKYGANAMLATRISFMNELARLCEKVGADIDNVRRGVGADSRIGRKFLYAGAGYGGSCFPKDVSALLKTSQEQGVELTVLRAVHDTNARQQLYAFEKIRSQYGNLRGKRIAVWGLAFKPGTDDVRAAPSLVIIGELLKAGAEVIGHDPEGTENFKREIGEMAGLTYAPRAYDALRNADGLVLLTEWREYKRPNWDQVAKHMRGRVVFDFRNQYHSENLSQNGFHYVCIGRRDTPAGTNGNSARVGGT